MRLNLWRGWYLELGRNGRPDAVKPDLPPEAELPAADRATPEQLEDPTSDPELEAQLQQGLRDVDVEDLRVAKRTHRQNGRRKAQDRRQAPSDRRATFGKPCPKCNERCGPRTIECMCGHRFVPKAKR